MLVIKCCHVIVDGLIRQSEIVSENGFPPTCVCVRTFLGVVSLKSAPDIGSRNVTFVLSILMVAEIRYIITSMKLSLPSFKEFIRLINSKLLRTHSVRVQNKQDD